MSQGRSGSAGTAGTCAAASAGRAVPALPVSAPRLSHTGRRVQGAAFCGQGAAYDEVRPGYPEEAVRFLVPSGAHRAVDVGAGTGLFTGSLVAHGLAVTAVDPAASMLEHLSTVLPGVRTVQATAEHTGLPDGCADVVTAAQAWHWVDPVAASAEAARVLDSSAPEGGVLGIVHNQLDVTVAWVHRLARIMHAGDVHRPQTPPEIGHGFAAPEGAWWTWSQQITPAGLHALMATRSYHLRASEATRAKMAANLTWYLHEHLGVGADEPLSLPYVTSAWRSVRV